MTPKEFAEAMAALETTLGGDVEAFHEEADKLMCRALNEAGYAGGVTTFQRNTSWYA